MSDRSTRRFWTEFSFPLLYAWFAMAGFSGLVIYCIVSVFLGNHETVVLVVQSTFLILANIVLFVGLFYMVAYAHKSSAKLNERTSLDQREIRQELARQASESNRMAQLSKPNFDQRLDHFVSSNIQAPCEPRNSRQATRFWQLRPFHDKTPAKSTNWIRTILYRIRQTLRG